MRNQLKNGTYKISFNEMREWIYNSPGKGLKGANSSKSTPIELECFEGISGLVYLKLSSDEYIFNHSGQGLKGGKNTKQWFAMVCTNAVTNEFILYIDGGKQFVFNEPGVGLRCKSDGQPTLFRFHVS